jgi:hypothetical protein
MIPESKLEPTEHGLVPKGEGWFVVNAREARWRHAEGRTAVCWFEGEPDFPQLGINLTVLCSGRAHGDVPLGGRSADFAALRRSLLIVEGQERYASGTSCTARRRSTSSSVPAQALRVLAVGARDRSVGPRRGGSPSIQWRPAMERVSR